MTGKRAVQHRAATITISRTSAAVWQRARRWLLAASFLLASSGTLAQEVVYQEQEVKAAFIYHFATFVEWPADVRDRETFRIAVFDADEIASELEKFLPGRTIHDRPMQVLRLESLDELQDVDLLFIGASQGSRLPVLLSQIETEPVLVVTDAPGALRDGSMINFAVVDDRVRFEIALDAARKVGLEPSSRLLSAAMYVDTTSAIPRRTSIMLAVAEAEDRP